MSKRQDQTHNQYASVIMAAMKKYGYSQRFIQSELGLCEGVISGLIRGQQFPSAKKVNAILDYLGIRGKKRLNVLEGINYQRLYPLINKPFINHRIHAMRTLQGKLVTELANDELSDDTIRNVEGGLSSVGPKRLEIFERALGKPIDVSLDAIDRLENMIKTYNEEDLLTMAYYLINFYESRNYPPKSE